MPRNIQLSQVEQHRSSSSNLKEGPRRGNRRGLFLLTHIQRLMPGNGLQGTVWLLSSWQCTHRHQSKSAWILILIPSLTTHVTLGSYFLTLFSSSAK